MSTLPTPGEIDAVIFDMIAAEAAGLGHTSAEARAGAWINVWWGECDLRAVPRSVPEGWMFEIYPPGEGGWLFTTRRRVSLPRAIHRNFSPIQGREPSHWRLAKREFGTPEMSSELLYLQRNRPLRAKVPLVFDISP
jgi:hypothetical protein